MLGELQEKLLCKRLEEQRNIIGKHDNLYGFRQEWSTEDVVNRALNFIINTEEKYVVCLYVDISEAFDNLWWPALLRRLRDVQCPRVLYKNFRNYCGDHYAGMAGWQNLQEADHGLPARVCLWISLLGCCH